MASTECVICNINKGTEATDMVLQNRWALVFIALGYCNLHHIIIAPPKHIDNLARLGVVQYLYLSYLSFLTEKSLLEIDGITQVKELVSGTKVKNHAHKHLYGTGDLTWDETKNVYENKLPPIYNQSQKEELRLYLQKRFKI